MSACASRLGGHMRMTKDEKIQYLQGQVSALEERVAELIVQVHMQQNIIDRVEKMTRPLDAVSKQSVR